MHRRVPGVSAIFGRTSSALASSEATWSCCKSEREISHSLRAIRQGSETLCSLPRRSPTLALQEFAKCYWPRVTSRLAAWVETEERSGGSRTGSSSPEVSEREQRQFQTDLDHLRVLVDSVRAAGKPVAIFYHPDRSSVRSEEDPPPVLYQKFRAWTENRGVPVLDMQAAWKGKSGVDRYYRDHIHLNERGNAAVARHLAAFVREHQFPLCRP